MHNPLFILVYLLYTIRISTVPEENRAMEHSTLEEGIRAAQRGDREGAYRLIRQALLEDSQYAPAWYYMSFLIDDPDRQRELGEALVRQQQDRSRGGERPERLGEYLLMHNLVNGDQLGAALAEQAAQRLRGKHTRIGELLVRSGWLAPASLNAMLDQQHQ